MIQTVMITNYMWGTYLCIQIYVDALRGKVVSIKFILFVVENNFK